MDENLLPVLLALHVEGRIVGLEMLVSNHAITDIRANIF